jgi:hypothetical protein
LPTRKTAKRQAVAPKITSAHPLPALGVAAVLRYI